MLPLMPATRGRCRLETEILLLCVKRSRYKTELSMFLCECRERRGWRSMESYSRLTSGVRTGRLLICTRLSFRPRN